MGRIIPTVICIPVSVGVPVLVLCYRFFTELHEATVILVMNCLIDCRVK
jgi:predicted tellurium resistance membrane protein TerC